jgi:hypothetical protein
VFRDQNIVNMTQFAAFNRSIDSPERMIPYYYISVLSIIAEKEDEKFRNAGFTDG